MILLTKKNIKKRVEKDLGGRSYQREHQKWKMERVQTKTENQIRCVWVWERMSLWDRRTLRISIAFSLKGHWGDEGVPLINTITFLKIEKVTWDCRIELKKMVIRWRHKIIQSLHSNLRRRGRRRGREGRERRNREFLNLLNEFGCTRAWGVSEDVIWCSVEN